jgi:DNA-binding response OmpR family regulator
MNANNHHLLLVEDEAHLAKGLRLNFEAEGYAVTIAGDAESALDLIQKRQKKFDAVVLDLMLPGNDGFHVLRELRRAGNYLPVIILTARGRPEDVLMGFAAGTDDYLAKPFEFSILLARVRGLLRRRDWMQSAQPVADTSEAVEVVELGGKVIDFRALEVRSSRRTFQLTQMESNLLRHLVRNAGKVVSRSSILKDVWGLHQDTDTRAIDNFIVRLRRYLEDEPSRPKHLLTVRGVGYKFVGSG